MLEEDFSILRVVITCSSAFEVPDDLWVGNGELGPAGNALGTMFQIEVLHTWPRIEQVDALGRLRPFFPRPLAPGNGGRLAGPGHLADPPLFGSVLHGAMMGYPDFGPGGMPFHSFYHYFNLLPSLLSLLRLPCLRNYRPRLARPRTALGSTTSLSAQAPTPPLLALPWYEDSTIPCSLSPPSSPLWDEDTTPPPPPPPRLPPPSCRLLHLQGAAVAAPGDRPPPTAARAWLPRILVPSFP